MRVQPDDPAYRLRAEGEAAFWTNPPLSVAMLESAHVGALKRFLDQSYTGDPNRSWMDDLVSRGPFRRAAALGSTEGGREAMWLSAGGSRTLDVYDIAPSVLAKARTHLRPRRFGLRWPNWRTRFFQADLNFVALPRNHYDVIWTTASLHHVTNLEYLLEEVEGSLRPGGLLAIHDYIGEPRLQYDAERLRAANAVLRQLPREFRYSDEIAPATETGMSPFEAFRSDETLDLVRARFDVLHLAEVEALFPILLHIDFAKIEREQPELVQKIFTAEEEARRNPAFRKCSMYGVFRKRAAS